MCNLTSSLVLHQLVMMKRNRYDSFLSHKYMSVHVVSFSVHPVWYGCPGIIFRSASTHTSIFTSTFHFLCALCSVPFCSRLYICQSLLYTHRTQQQQTRVWSLRLKSSSTPFRASLRAHILCPVLISFEKSFSEKRHPCGHLRKALTQFNVNRGDQFCTTMHSIERN